MQGQKQYKEQKKGCGGSRGQGQGSPFYDLSTVRGAYGDERTEAATYQHASPGNGGSFGRGFAVATACYMGEIIERYGFFQGWDSGRRAARFAMLRLLRALA